jgi:CubicO group peptidase (beta-lactamase class C family)
MRMHGRLTRRLFLAASAAAAGCQTRLGGATAQVPTAAWESAAPPHASAAVALDALLSKLDTTSVVAVHEGRVIHRYGDERRLSYLASARKSLVSLLYGPSIANGRIHPEATLEVLGFDDLGGLSPLERTATIRDLLQARSGVYHPAANLGDASARAPARGSVKPGTHFLYNNWDFNALGALFEKSTGRKLYTAFGEDIARPIGCEDWDENLHAAQAIRNDTGASSWPAHHFVLSTRDMARVGLLMLRGGRWGDAQIVPRAWVKLTTAISTPAAEVARTSQFIDGLAYGYLWWVFDPVHPWPDAMKNGYTASGAFGQFITVLPKLDLVIAHKTQAPSKLNVPPERYFAEIVPAVMKLVH